MLKRRILGRTGLAITPLGFGSQTIGGLGYGDQDWEQSQPTADAYLNGGGRFIDTARGYGVSEIYVGKALKRFERADEVVVCSKSGSWHPPITRSDMEVSRFCLQRDWIDVYCVHVPPPDFDQLRRVLDVYDQFRKEGKIRFIGVSQTPQHPEWALQQVEDGRVDVMQFAYSFMRPGTGQIMEAVAKHGVGVVVRQALEGGMFTDKFKPGHRFTDRANDWCAQVVPEAMEQALRQIDEIRRQFVKPPYKSLAQLALAFVLAHPSVTATIPGAGSPGEMRDNMSVQDVAPMPGSLAAELIEAGRGLDELFSQRR